MPSKGWRTHQNACAEGDVNLLGSGEYFDPHAIAGLLKTFLRDLPVHVLTRELQHQFLQVTDLTHRPDKVNELGVLIAQLPLANYTLLRFLTAHLIHVVQNEKTNKMSLRNVGIVFSPTLAIPATLFSLLLTEFDIVFAVRSYAIRFHELAPNRFFLSCQTDGW